MITRKEPLKWDLLFDEEAIASFAIFPANGERHIINTGLVS
jgi:hypothetical protein